MNIKLFMIAFVVTAAMTGCIKTESQVNVKAEPIEIKPIEVKIDINLRVEKELDDFFGDLDK